MDKCWAAVTLCPTILPIFAMVDNSWYNKHLKQKETFLSSLLISYNYIYIYIYTPQTPLSQGNLFLRTRSVEANYLRKCVLAEDTLYLVAA